MGTLRDICYSYAGSNTPVVNTEDCIAGDGTIANPIHLLLVSGGDLVCNVSGLGIRDGAITGSECGTDDLGTSTIIDFSSGLKQKTVTLISNPTALDFSGNPQKCWHTLEVINGGNGNNTITWDSDIFWIGTAPQPTVGASGSDPISVFQFWFDGTNYHGRQ